MFFRIVFSVCLVAGLLVDAHGQGFRRPQGNSKRQMPAEPFAATGKIEAVGQGVVKMLTTSNQLWMVWIDPKAEIHVTGTAEADFVRPGMFVRFTAELDQRGQAQNKVDKLTLFTPSEKSPLGVWPEGAGPAAGGEAGEGGAGIAGNVAPLTNVFTVAGRITANRNGKLTMNALRGVVTFELAEKPTVGVDVTDYSIAKRGDKISVTKGKMFVGRMGMARANALTIELAEPLTLPGKKKKPSKGKSATPERSDTEPQKEPADG